MDQENHFQHYEQRKRNFLFEDLPKDLWRDYQLSDDFNVTQQTHRNSNESNYSKKSDPTHTMECSQLYQTSIGEEIFPENHPLQTCTECISSAKKRYSTIIPAEKESFETAEILNNYYDSKLIRNQETYRRETERFPLKACGVEAIQIKMVNEQYCKNNPHKESPLREDIGKLTVSPEFNEKTIHFNKKEHTDTYNQHDILKTIINYDKHKRKHQRQICPENEINIEPVHSAVSQDNSSFKKMLPKSSTIGSLNISRTRLQSQPKLFVNKQIAPITIKHKNHKPDVAILDAQELMTAKSAVSLDQYLSSQEMQIKTKFKPSIHPKKDIAKRSQVFASEEESKNIPLDQHLKEHVDSDKAMIDEEYLAYVLQPPSEEVTMDDQLKEIEVVESVVGMEKVLPTYSREGRLLLHLSDLESE